MRKIIYLVTALMIFITALFITSPKAYASTWNNVYVFDELETTFYGVTLSIEEGTNVFTLNGTSTAQVGQNYTFDDMFTPNSNGSSLSHLKKYVIYYEYISGTMTGSTYVIQSGSSGLKQIQVQQNNYTQNKGYLQTYTETTFHRTSSTSSSQFTNFKYRLHILEFENELQDDDVFFTELSSQGTTVIYTIQDAYTVHLSGSYTTDSPYNLTTKVNSKMLNSDKPILVAYEYVSGTKTGSQSVQVSGADIMQLGEETKAVVAEDITQILIARGSSGSFTDYTFKLHFQEIELYSETVDPPESIYLPGSYWQDIISFNPAEDPLGLAGAIPYASYVYVSTSTDNTFDLSLLDLNQLTITSDSSWNRFFIALVSGGYEEIGGVGDFTYKKVDSNLVIEKTIDDDVDDSISVPLTEVDFLVIQYGEDTIYTVSFNTSGGSSVSTQNVSEGDLATEPAEPTRSGYEFSHWVITGTETIFDFSTSITANLSLTAVWNALPGTEWIITFLFNGGTASYGPYVTTPNDSILTPPPNPTRAGYDFLEWRVVGTGLPYNFNTPVTSDLTLSAVWESNSATVYTITFNTEGGTDINDIFVEEGDQVDAPSEPLRSGYEFINWVITGTETIFDFSASITENLSLTAVWNETEIYFNIITFIENGGSPVESQIINPGEFPVQPEDPIRPGYTFAGWFTNIALTQEYIFVDEAMESDLTLYAKWTPVSGGGDPITDEPTSTLNTWFIIGGLAAVGLVALALTDKKKGKRR